MSDADNVTPDKLKPGDRVDLEGDPYLGKDPSVEFEYALVADVDTESEKEYGIVLVGFEGFGVVGYPAGHEMRRVPNDPVVEWEVTITETWRVHATNANEAIELAEAASSGTHQDAATLVDQDRQAWPLLND